MSPSGKYSQERDDEREKSPTDAGEGVPVTPSMATPEAGARSAPAALPLRLSVARGGLGLELCEPVLLGPLVVEELEVALPGLTYPLDLSKGVKQFRNRRSVLRHAVVRLDLEALSRAWESALGELFEEPMRVRLRSIFERGPGAAVNEGQATSAISVSIHGEDRALAFDLVITSGMAAGIAVDAPRTVGMDGAPLTLAFRAIDAGLAASSGGVLTLRREGRGIELGGLCEALALMVLPSLGCRLPSVTDQVIKRVESTPRGLLVTVGTKGEPFASGRRALRLSLLVDFLRSADQLLSVGDSPGARAAYLDALERAPGHQETLIALAELDLTTGDRGEAALSFLEELGAVLEEDALPAARARFFIALGRALLSTGREELIGETWERASVIDSDPVIAALLRVDLASRAEDQEEARRHLDGAVSRAPFLQLARRKRFALALSKGDLKTASADAEQMEAAETEPFRRATACLLTGRTFLRAGFRDVGEDWLRRSLRLRPDDPETMFELGACLAQGGEELRAAELFQGTLRGTERLLKGAGAGETRLPPRPLSVAREERLRALKSRAHFELARLFAHTGGGEAEALSHLAAVETRLDVGLEARLMEAGLHIRAGRSERRDRTLTRLLEAIEMGWITVGDHLPRIRQMVDQVRDTADGALLLFAERVLGDSASAEESDSAASEVSEGEGPKK